MYGRRETCEDQCERTGKSRHEDLILGSYESDTNAQFSLTHTSAIFSTLRFFAKDTYCITWSIGLGLFANNYFEKHALGAICTTELGVSGKKSKRLSLLQNRTDLAPNE